MQEYQIRADITTTKDNYREGQTDITAEWIEEKRIEAETPREAIIIFYADIGYQLDFETVNGHRLYTSQLVDEDNTSPTKDQLAEWRADELTLYTLDINLQIYDIVPTEAI